MRLCATTLESEMTEAERVLLYRVFRRFQRVGCHLEIGTAAGGTLCYMMRCFSDDRRPSFVVVDRMTYFPHQQSIIESNLRRYHLDPRHIDFRAMTSSIAFQHAMERSERFDFILIDAQHTILPFTADLRWARLLNVNGILCFHDYTPRFPGVYLTVNRFLRRYHNYEIVGREDSLLALRKTGHSRCPEMDVFDRAYALSMYLPLQVQRKWRKFHRKRMGKGNTVSPMGVAPSDGHTPGQCQKLRPRIDETWENLQSNHRATGPLSLNTAPVLSENNSNAGISRKSA